MKMTIMPFEYDKRDKVKSELYTFSQRKGLTLFTLSLMPYYDMDYLDLKDRKQVTEEIEFFATSKETALAELTENIKLFYNSGLDDYKTYELCCEEGFIRQELRDIYKKINGKELDITQFDIVEFLELNNHYRYVTRKLQEKVRELSENGIELVDNELVYIDEEVDSIYHNLCNLIT